MENGKPNLRFLSFRTMLKKIKAGGNYDLPQLRSCQLFFECLLSAKSAEINKTERNYY
jgi:hypothetical protein